MVGSSRRVLGSVAVERAAVKHVEELHPAADAEHRESSAARRRGEAQLELIAVRRDVGERRVWGPPVARWVEIAPEAEQDSVGHRERPLGVAEIREHERESPDPLEGAAERQAQVVAVVGEARGDQDHRSGRARGISRAIHQSSRCFISFRE
jgi:hypothetical protein